MSEQVGVFAVVPVKDLQGTKSRLAPVLNPHARAGLTLYMMGRVVRALREAGVGDVCVVSPDPVVLNEALRRGASPLLQKSQGLNPALEEARVLALERDAATLLVLPADLPLLDPTDVRAVIEGAGPGVVLAPDGARSGTNALLSNPPDAMPFLFGPDSFEAHQRAARGRGLELQMCERPHLAFDLDTAEDLARLKDKGVPHQ